MATYKAQS